MTSLNIGAGFDSKGDIKLDIVISNNPDVQATATSLPFVDETFDLVIMDQVLEHISPDELGSVFEEVYRVLKPGGILRGYVPHAATRLNDQDPTHKSSWTYKTPEYFADGNFSWYYEDTAFDFKISKREVSVWSHKEVFLSSLRSVFLQSLYRFFGEEDSLLYWPTVAGSIKFELEKI